MSWYRTGTISVTDQSAVVTGFGTMWLSDVRAGDIFIFEDKMYEVLTVDSDTQMTLHTVYTGTTASAQTYAIVINYNRTTNATIAQKISNLVNSWIKKDSEFGNWASGSATGGTNSDGLYDITNSDGSVSNIPSPEKIASMASAGQAPIVPGSANAIVKSNSNGSVVRSGVTIDADNGVDGMTIGGHKYRVGNSPVVGGVAELDAATGSVFSVDIGATPFSSIAMKSVTGARSFMLDISNTGSANADVSIFPANSGWNDGVQPSITVRVGGFVSLGFYTLDGGLSYRWYQTIPNGG